MSVDTEMSASDAAIVAEMQDLTRALLAVLSHKQSTSAAALGACLSIIAYTINERNDDIEAAEEEVRHSSDELRRMVSNMHEAHRVAVAMGVEAGHA